MNKNSRNESYVPTRGITPRTGACTHEKYFLISITNFSFFRFHDCPRFEPRALLTLRVEKLLALSRAIRANGTQKDQKRRIHSSQFSVKCLKVEIQFHRTRVTINNMTRE